jgi:glucose-1-phosphatase
MVKNIIFDMGNVIIDVDIPKTYYAFAQLAGVTVEDVKDFFETQGYYHAYEKGAFDDNAFRNHVRDHLGKTLADDAIDTAWCDLLLDMPKERLDRIKALGSNYRIFLLSNTNAIHIKEINRRAALMKHDFLALFEIPFLSCEMKLMKPGAEIYKQVLQKANIKAGESLFIDDNETNIKAAAELGLQTIWLNPLGSLLDKLSNY